MDHEMERTIAIANWAIDNAILAIRKLPNVGAAIAALDCLKTSKKCLADLDEGECKREERT